MEPIDASNIAVVTDALGPERRALLDLLSSLEPSDWDRETECPAYSVKGIATHLLGDDLSLLSRQRDGAVQGLILVAEKMPGVDFRTLLNAFNDQWVEAARFLSPPMLLAMLEMSGDWTETYYTEVDPNDPCEPVPLYSPPPGEFSPFWQAIGREYLERWAHQSQILRALDMPSLSDSPFLEVGASIVASAAGVAPTIPAAGDTSDCTIGPIVLGPRQQAADILTLSYHEADAFALLEGPAELTAEFAARVGRAA